MTAPTAAPEAVTLDDSVLRSLYAMCAAGDRALVDDLVDTYLDSTPRQIDALRGAIEAHDLERVVRTLHSMKGSAATIGALRLAAVCRSLEQSVRSGRVQLERSVIEILERELATLLAALRELADQQA